MSVEQESSLVIVAVSAEDQVNAITFKDGHGILERRKGRDPDPVRQVCVARSPIVARRLRPCLRICLAWRRSRTRRWHGDPDSVRSQLPSLDTLTVTTRDGRSLTVYDAGDPDGRPIVFHHGTPMTGTPFEPHVAYARENGLRLVSFDRAGYRDSSRDAGRTVADVAKDVEVIADALGLQRFATWGLSGGGPHALATAAGLPDRVVAVATAASVAPPGLPDFELTDGMGEGNIVEFGLARQGEESLRPYLERETEGIDDLDVAGLVDSMRTVLSDLDAATLDGGVGAFILECFRTGLARGVDGWLDDDLAFVQPWGFELAAINTPSLVIQGRQDLMVPWSHGEWLAANVSGAEAWLREDEGHLTLFVRLAPGIHDWLAARF